MMMPTVAVFVIVAVAAVRAAFGLEGGLHLHELRSKAMEHSLNHVVGPNAKNLVSNFCGQMPVSKVPRKAHKLMRIFMPDFDDQLRSTLNLPPPPVFQLQAISIGHRDRFRKVEKDIFALIRSQANSATLSPVEIQSESAFPFSLLPVSASPMNACVVHRR